jgi:hypothetical protein
MTFVPFMIAARIATATVTVGMLVAGVPVPSQADGNLPHTVVRQDETILFPVPDCPKCLAVFHGHYPDDDVFAADCVCPD